MENQFHTAGRVRNLVSHITGRTGTGDVWEQSDERNIWTQKGCSDWGLKSFTICTPRQILLE
jgi:hypothetical protein